MPRTINTVRNRKSGSNYNLSATTVIVCTGTTCMYYTQNTCTCSEYIVHCMYKVYSMCILVCAYCTHYTYSMYSVYNMYSVVLHSVYVFYCLIIAVLTWSRRTGDW